MLPEDELLQQAAGAGVVAERMGLTPDWIISTTAFNVFQLPVRTTGGPVYAGVHGTTYLLSCRLLCLHT